MAIRLSTTLKIVTVENKDIHDKEVFRPNEQGVVGIVRTLIIFGVKKKSNRCDCGNLKFYSLSICRVEVNADTYSELYWNNTFNDKFH